MDNPSQPDSAARDDSKHDSVANTAGSMKKRAIRGTLIALFGHGVSQSLRLGSNLILTRLLFPEAFGVMALVRMVTMGLGMLSDVGIKPSIIQHARGDVPSFLNTAWTLTVIRGVLIFVAGAIVAVPFANFYGESQLALLLVATVFSSAVIIGFESTKLVTLNRQILLGRLVTIDLVAHICAVVAMVGHAYFFRSVWALVIGAVVHETIRMVLSHAAIPGPNNRFAWDKPAVRDILSFGKWIFLSTLITFLAMRFDVAVLGKLIPMDLLGVYSLAIMLGAMPREVADRVMALVLLPALAASARENHAALVTSFNRARRSLLPLGGLAFLGAALVAPAFFQILYDPRYHEAGWMAQLVMVHAWLSFLHEGSSRALLAVGDSRSLALSNGVKLVATAVGCLLGMHLGGMVGFIIGFGFGALAGHATVIVKLMGHGLPTALVDASYTVAGIGVGLAVTWGGNLAAEALGTDPVLVGLVLGIVVLVPLSLWVFLRLRGEIKR